MNPERETDAAAVDRAFSAAPAPATAADPARLAALAGLIGDPTRAAMLTALISGRALTASELAAEAHVSAATASAHLAKLEAGGLVSRRRRGRLRYAALADEAVGAVLVAMNDLAARMAGGADGAEPVRRPEPELTRARVCYNHMAGELGVELLEALVASGRLARSDGRLSLTQKGRRFLVDFGIDLDAVDRRRGPICRSCLDWSEQRDHLAGPLGAALLQRVLALGWAQRVEASRSLDFTDAGEAALRAHFAIGESGGRRV